MVPSVRVRDNLDPTASSLPVVSGTICPQVQRSNQHVTGEVRCGLLTYADLNAFAWSYGGGWLAVNRGRRGLTQAYRGAEDATQIRR